MCCLQQESSERTDTDEAAGDLEASRTTSVRHRDGTAGGFRGAVFTVSHRDEYEGGQTYAVPEA